MLVIAIASVGAALAATAIAIRLARRLHATRRELDAMREAAQLRMDQMAVLSHEVRTPLALILGPVNLLLEGSPGPLLETQRSFLQTVRRNARLIQDMSEDILTQSRIEAGMFHPVFEDVDMRALGIRAIAELRTLYPQPIVFDCPGMPPVVRGDPRLLHQALVNLLTNACKHSEGALVTLRVRRQTFKTLVSVDDHGIGMDSAARAAAFRRYHTSAAERGGIGLGMTITKEIVRMHGSDLHIQSTPRAGTTMMFSLTNAENADAAEEVAA